MRLLSLLLVVALVATVARADEREDRETARREFAAGQAADKRRAYAEAIEHYMRANELVPHPFAMFNIAVDLERIGKLRDAASWYEKFLDSSTTRDADRDKVNRTLIDLRNRPGQVTVTSNPDGARVIINGLPIGTTPYRGELKGGMYLVVVQKGTERDSKEITIEYGEPVKVEFAFSNATATPAVTSTPQKPVEIRKPPPPRGANGTLFVRGEPYGALVHVDNVPIGTLPLTVPLDVGTHAIKVTADGFATYEQPVTITPNARTPIDVRLARALGTIEQQPGGPPKPRVGYIIGGGGGADAKGNGAIYLGELGIRGGQYDLSSRIGKLDDVFVVDLMLRYAFTKTRLAPYVGGGYSFVSEGYGYTVFGGLRFDIVDGEKGGVSLMAEGGYRFYSSTTSEPGEASKTTEGVIVPIMASLLVRYR